MIRPRNRLDWIHKSALVLLATALAWSAHPALAECDVAPPVLTNFAFSPSVIDVGLGPAGVTCDMTFTDAPSGIAEANCSFRAPGFLQVQSCSATAPSSGDRNNGTFSCTVDIPRYAESGNWRASVIGLDQSGNVLQVLDAQLEFVLMLPVNLNVASTPDVTAPALTAFNPTPAAPDVSGGPVNVACSATVSDALAGVSRIACLLQRPSADFGRVCIATAPVSGDRNNGTFSCDVTVEQYAEAGDWLPTLVVYDGVENASFYDSTALALLGQPSAVTVTSAPEDLTLPALTGFDFTPKNLDVAAAARGVICNTDVTDNLSGVDLVTCSFESPSLLQTAECSSNVPSSGTPTAGTFTCNTTVPAYSEGGTWKASLAIYDRSGNLRAEDATTLGASGYPTDLDVDCGATTPAFVASFASGSTITWNPVAGAFLYNVYRGYVLDLGTSYGDCQNASDPNPTDTTFVDTMTPVHGAPLFYLVSYVSVSGEAGLGNSSNGTPRAASPPCP